jgi:phosphoglycerol transferase MdoB-like AlkP superfamily enzyme
MSQAIPSAQSDSARASRRLASDVNRLSQRDGSARTPQPRRRFGRLFAGLQHWLGRHSVVAAIFLIALVCFTLLRLTLVIVFAEPTKLSLAEWALLLWAGFRFDCLVGLCLMLPQAIHLTVLSHKRLVGRASHVLLELEWLLMLVFILITCLIEFLFFADIGSRLNYIAFEYLVYPTEVCCNLWQSYPVVPLLVVVAVVGLSVYALIREHFVRRLYMPIPWRARWRRLAAMPAAIMLLIFTTGMDSMQVSTNRAANECAGNGLYTFVYYAWTCRLDFEHFYVTIPLAEATKRVRRQVGCPTDQFLETSVNPLDRIVTSKRPQRDWNVVLILEESLGSDFIGGLGDDRGLTPHFDALAREGVLFDNFYATGNRTARALEAVLASLPPLPTESILKRDHSDHVYTLAHVLAERGYARLFMTGGRGLFDGVRSFMTANGFERFVEQKDFNNPVFTNAWGVSDEDLFHRAIDELDQLHEEGRPFFATILTVSNHRPFTFPVDRIPEQKATRENAVKYADWALGDFFARARTHAFFEKTLFVALGDHGARVYGSQMFPMKSYRVPVLLIQPAGEDRGTRCHTLGCSLDIAPTIMGRLGGNYRSVFFGRDVLSLTPKHGYALMQHNHDVALLDARNHMAVLGSRKSAWSYHLDPTTFVLQQAPQPEGQMVRDTIALFQLANYLYYNDLCFPEADTDTRAMLP